jgi:nucleoside-diphosphate-sugar epimerase
MKNILITGASGLIGYEVIKQIDRGAQIYAVSRNAPESVNRNPKVIIRDLASSYDISGFPREIDSVIHLAQSEHFREFPDRAEHVFGVNTLSTLRLLDYARHAGAKSFIYASSGGVYGYGDTGFHEEQPIVWKKDLGFYIATKLCSEIIAENYSPYMNIIILRFFFVYGPRQKNTMLIPRLINSVREKKPITLQGKEGIQINPTFVGDAAGAVVKAIGLDHSYSINVGGPDVLTLRCIGEIIGHELGIEPRFEVQEGAEPRSLMGDIHLMSRLLGPPKTTFREGIASMIRQE